MRRRATTALRSFALAAFTLFVPPAMADEVRVFAAGAAKHALEAVGPAFQQATGHTLRARYDTVGALRDRVLQVPPGQAADLVILSDAALERLRAQGRLADAPSHRIGHVEVALAVPLGATAPDLPDAAALRRALLDAPSLAYADPARGATAGSHFAKVVEALGLGEALRGKTTVLPFGVDVIQAVSQGRFALGVSQSSEIMQHPGIRFAGALPPPYALTTGYGIARASDSAAAGDLLAFLGSPDAMREFRRSGFLQAP